jgi:two-component system sensor histidine kinase NreB
MRQRLAGWLTVEVADDGAGFDATVQPRCAHVGLFSVRERAEALGGNLDIISRVGAGTRVILSVPLGGGPAGALRGAGAGQG